MISTWSTEARGLTCSFQYVLIYYKYFPPLTLVRSPVSAFGLPSAFSPEPNHPGPELTKNKTDIIDPGHPSFERGPSVKKSASG